MKHKVKGRKLSRTRKQRKALARSVLASLILHGKIKTTEAKAREIRPLAEKIISKTKKGIKMNDKGVFISRELGKILPEAAVKKIISDIAPKFESRTSGYTRIIKISQRKSDGARMAVIEFV